MKKRGTIPLEKNKGKKKRSGKKNGTDHTDSIMFYLLYGSIINLIFFNIGQDSITVVENRSKEYKGADLYCKSCVRQLHIIYFLICNYLWTVSCLAIQDLNAGSIDANTMMPNSANDVFGLSSSMTAPLIHGGNVNAIMPQFDMYRNSSTMGSPYIQGGYTNLLMKKTCNLS
jgi:hypothetical protein